MASPFPFLVLFFVSVLSLASAELPSHIVLVAGGDKNAVNLPATEAKLQEPFGTDVDSHGNLWIVEMETGGRLLRVDSKGELMHWAGHPKTAVSGHNGLGLQAEFKGAHNLAVLPNGNILIADTFDSRLKEVNAGTGAVSISPLEKPPGAKPFCIALGPLLGDQSHMVDPPSPNQVYMVDLSRAYVIDLRTHHFKVLAGNGKKGVPQDGAVAVDAPLVDPRAIAPDYEGNVYILERGGNALRVVDPSGHIRTVVNASGKKGATGDGGPALQATMNGPKHLCVDLDGSVIIADAENNLVRRYNPKDGMMTRVAGVGGRGGSAGVGGDPKQCQLSRPHGVTVNAKTGELYITDSYNNRVLKIVKD